MTTSGDDYARGMVHWNDAALELTPALDRWQVELFQHYLGRRILEVGAGAGRMTVLVAEAGQHEELVALEPSSHFFGLLQKSASGLPRTTLVQAETSALLPKYASHFDSVYSVHVLEHIEDDRQLLEQMLALTRPGGNVIILVPALQFLFSELDRNIGHFRRYNKRMVRVLVRGLPVEIEKLTYNNLLGVLGSLYFSKIRKINYQKDETARRKFFGAYSFFSKNIVPYVRSFES